MTYFIPGKKSTGLYVSVEYCWVSHALYDDILFPHLSQDSIMGPCFQQMTLMNSRLFF